MRWVAAMLVFSAGISWAERFDTCATIVLENETLRVELYADRPAPLCYLHKPSGERLAGCGPDGVWRLNGQDLPWPRWRVTPYRRSDGTGLAYEMRLSGTNLRVQAHFVLRDNALEMQLENIADPDGLLQTLEWCDMPLLSCRRPEYTYWREVWTSARWFGGVPAAWSCHPESGRLADARIDGRESQTARACVYKPEAFCAFVASNNRGMPLRDSLTTLCASRAYTVSLNTYHARSGEALDEALRARIVFLQDVNLDGRCDHQDYAVWTSRHERKTLPPLLATASPEAGPRNSR